MKKSISPLRGSVSPYQRIKTNSDAKSDTKLVEKLIGMESVNQSINLWQNKNSNNNWMML